MTTPMNAVLWHLKRNKRKSSVYWCNETTIGHRAAVTGIDYPAALFVIAPYPAFFGIAVPDVPAARYCKRSF